jgi:hypothetical protein
MANLDLGLLTKGEVSSLIGHDRGLAARRLFELDRLDLESAPVHISAPSNLEALTPSFVQGLFASSVHALGEQQFFYHYIFDINRALMEDVRLGVQRALMARNIAGAA